MKYGFNPITRSVCVAASIAAVVALAQVATTSNPPATTTTTNSQNGIKDPGVRGGAASAGTPLPGLTTGQRAAFEEAKDVFEEVVFVRNPPPDGDAGLGPGFNSDSCSSCHDFPATGGSSPRVNPQVAVATKMGANNRVPSFIKADGPVLEVRFKRNRDGSPDGGVHNLFTIAGRSDAPGCSYQQEDFSDFGNLSFRIPTPTFGLGLVEAITDSTLRQNLSARAAQKAMLGISGRFNTSGNDGTIMRFGWKAQNKSLVIFAGEAYNVESGVTNPLFPHERNEAGGCMYNPLPEDTDDFDADEANDITPFATFMRFLAPPARGPINDSVRSGANLFESVGCALCHTPSMRTGPSAMAALSRKEVPLYSDVALHNMGAGLADEISQGVATGSEFRTAPLWGLGQRIFLLHDGRTKDLIEAIRAHSSRGSEANEVIQRFNNLNSSQTQELLNFLRSL